MNDRGDRAPDTAQDFAAWIQPHVTAMTRLAARIAPASESDDVVQEALIRAWQKRGTFDPAKGTPSTWLLALTADKARRARQRSRPTHEVHEIAAPGVTHEARVDLDRAIGTLAPRQRLAVDCVYFVGLSVAETAAVMDCAEGTVKSTLADARHRLRSLLEPEDGPN